MVYFKVDDGFFAHPKTELVTLEAIGLWTLCGSYCCRYLSDGFVSHATVRKLSGGNSQLAASLVQAGLWEEVVDGYLFHEWDHFQQLKSDVEHRREQDRVRQNKHRMSRRDTPVTPQGVQTDPRKGMDRTGISSSTSSKDDDFEAFWKAFPRHPGSKKKARENWAKAIKSGADPQEIISAAAAYAKWLVTVPDPPKVKWAQGWLTERRWEIDYVTTASKPTEPDPFSADSMFQNWTAADGGAA